MAFIVQVAHVRGAALTVLFIVQVARVRGTQIVLFIVQDTRIRPSDCAIAFSSGRPCLGLTRMS